MQDNNWKKAAPEVPEEFHMRFEETIKQIEGQKLWHTRAILKDWASPRHRTA